MDFKKTLLHPDFVYFCMLLVKAGAKPRVTDPQIDTH